MATMLSKENQALLRAALKGMRHKGGLEFTYKDMKEMYMTGGDHGRGRPVHPMGFERVMRTRYPERYVRKPKAKGKP